MLGHSPLPGGIDVQSGLDLDDLWDRFEIFEALHHSVDICNPMTACDVASMVVGLSPAAGQQVLDIACGNGATLFALAGHAAISGVGVDLSPWMLRAAVDRHERTAADADLHWVLADARRYGEGQQFDIVTCLGAEWVWHDFNGTARAVAARTRPGGRAAIGAGRLHHRASQETVARERGRVETIAEQREMLRRHGFEVTGRIDPTDADWDGYLQGTADAAQIWAQRYPGARSERWMAEQQEWQAAREADRGIIGWSTWLLRRTR